MTIQQSKADTAPATDVKAGAKQPAQVTPQFRAPERRRAEVTPRFRARGIPAPAAAPRRPPTPPAESKRELPHFLRQPHYS